MKSKIFTVLVIVSLVIVVPIANAQISVGEKADQKSVEIVLSEDEVKVKHVIRSSNLPVDLELIDGTVSNIVVTNDEGNEVLFTINDEGILLIQPSKEDVIVEYDLNDVLVEKNNVVTWDFLYLESTSFILPEQIDFVIVNERPVYLGDMRGINCHGCQMLLEYSTNELQINQNVKWEEQEFLVEITSNSNIENFVFDQPSKSITFDVSEENRFVNTIIPLELLWGPYSVFLDEEKILFQEYFNNGTHVWVTMVPKTSGEITIIGTTVVPEFSMMIPLIVGFFAILALPFMKKVSLH